MARHTVPYQPCLFVSLTISTRQKEGEALEEPFRRIRFHFGSIVMVDGLGCWMAWVCVNTLSFPASARPKSEYGAIDIWKYFEATRPLVNMRNVGAKR